MTRKIRNSIIFSVMVLTLPLSTASSLAQGASGSQFHVEEKSITDIQSAIKSRQTSCKQVVQAYFERAKAYNGACTALLTKDGAPIPPSTGMVRAGSPLKYPTQTVAASTVFPDLDQYEGLSIEFGHSRGRPAQRSGNPEHSRGTLRHLQGRFRQSSLRWPTASWRSRCLRRVPQDARRPRACR